jgi:cell division protein FtsN
MSRLLRILLYIIFFVLIFFWFSGIMKSCNQKKMANEPGVATEENVQAVEDEVEDIVSEFFEDDSEGDTSESSTEGTSSAEEEFEANENASELKSETTKEDNKTTQAKPAKESTPPRKAEAKESTLAATKTSSKGPYMIIAGSFSVEENAEKMVNRLKSMGYYDAEKIVFDKSKYYSVSASRFSSKNEAIRAVSELKAKGVDCYVQRAQ